MKIAILSDIHDNIWNLNAALLAVQSTDLMICCGDLCSPFIIPIMAKQFSKPIHVVFGNNDGDLFRITKNASGFSNLFIEGELFKGELDGKTVIVNHYDYIALEIARAGAFDLVCFGHNHRYQVERFGRSLAINPGTIMGYSPLDQSQVPPTFVIYDTRTDQATGYQVYSSNNNQAALVVKHYP